MLLPRFDYKKAIEVILRITNQPGTDAAIPIQRVFSLMFLIDRQHLRLHGRLITGETYMATLMGPVPLHSHSLLSGDTPVDLTMDSYLNDRLIITHDIYNEGKCRYIRISPGDTGPNSDLLSRTDHGVIVAMIAQYFNPIYHLEEALTKLPMINSYRHMLKTQPQAIIGPLSLIDNTDTSQLNDLVLTDDRIRTLKDSFLEQLQVEDMLCPITNTSLG